jgi:hypothetical protein
LFGDRIDEPLVGHNQKSIGRHQISQAIHCGLDHCPAAEQIEQLFGARFSTGWPKSSAAAASHDYRV